MADYGVTNKGFVLKRADAIMEEIHSDLTAGFGCDTRSSEKSFLNVLVTTFTGQIADLWETAQDSYYAKYPSSADGISLDNAIQYGGIRRTAAKRSCYPLHCTGSDGTPIPEGSIVQTSTLPKIKLSVLSNFEIAKSSFNKAKVIVSSLENNAVYTLTINGIQYKYQSKIGSKLDVLNGLADTMTDTQFTVTVDMVNGFMLIEDKQLYRSNEIKMSSNLTTQDVTSIINFYTADYGKFIIPYNIITEMVNNISGFTTVTNMLEPTYGRDKETDIELRQSYLAKSALRSNTMIESIVSELINNVSNVESASGYENDTDVVDENGLPPHSIEIIAEGGDESLIAEAILKRKAGGIQTYGEVEIKVPGSYGDTIPIHFNRPEFLYAWVKVVVHGNSVKIPSNYAALVKASLLEDGFQMKAGSSLYSQLLNEGIYNGVAGVTYVDITTAYSTDSSYVPDDADFNAGNIIVSMRQKILLDENRIEVTFDADS